MMSGNEFGQLLIRLGLKPAEAAQLLSVNPRTIRRWLDGEEVTGSAEQAVRAWIRLHDRHLPWRPDSVSIAEDDQDQIARLREHAIGFDEVITRVEERGGPRLPWLVDWDRGKATLGPMEVSFYKLLNGGFSLGTYRRTDGDPDVGRDREVIDDAVCCIAQAHQKRNPDFGPVTLVVHNGPWKGRVGSQQLQSFPTARDAIRHVCEKTGSPGFHDPFVVTKGSAELLWDAHELRRECDRRSKAPPALTALAGYVRTNSALSARSGPQIMTRADAKERQLRIKALADELDELAIMAGAGCVQYPEFERVLVALHAEGFFPAGELVSNVAHALVRE